MKAAQQQCPVCKKKTAAAYRPFCSRRCSEVDLGRWLGGKYIIPGPPLSEDDDLEQADREPEDEA